MQALLKAGAVICVLWILYCGYISEVSGLSVGPRGIYLMSQVLGAPTRCPNSKGSVPTYLEIGKDNPYWRLKPARYEAGNAPCR